MRRFLVTVATLAVLVGGEATAFAQTAIEGRVDRLEREMKAVQRKVFPGGNGQYFPPEITAPETATTAPGVPATSAVADLTARVSALETQLSSLTGQIEQNQHKLQLLEDSMGAYRRATDARLKAIEEASAAAPGNTPAAPIATDPKPAATATGNKPAPAATATTKPAGAVTSTANAPVKLSTDPARLKLVNAVEKPSTGDPAEDGYVYGYRLWQAKLYPEAEAQLIQVVAKYPKHRRASWAQNLLGRAYLDEGRPSLASHAFYDNYKNFQDGERTPDSLYYLGLSLRKLGKPSSDVCKVYDELLDVYGARISPALKADVMKARTTEKCKAI